MSWSINPINWLTHKHLFSLCAHELVSKSYAPVLTAKNISPLSVSWRIPDIKKQQQPTVAAVRQLHQGVQRLKYCSIWKWQCCVWYKNKPHYNVVNEGQFLWNHLISKHRLMFLTCLPCDARADCFTLYCLINCYSLFDLIDC